ncbi:MAG: YlxM family DNA-binding protein [Lachnospiraceae bacterium]|nr:YlxM family DNA-binding protein [Lachnospiraceae bacterium]
MEKFVEQSLLYDFYGELLTEHQKRVFEEVILNDYSLSEVAQDLNISRQGVHDMIKRCNKILEDYESKLHLVERFVRIREKIHRIYDLTGDEEIKALAQEILEEL